MVLPAAAPSVSGGNAIPEMRIGHFLSLCDSTGMLQHAVHSVPDRAHGYCVDDNARALLLSSALANSGDAQLLSEIGTTTLCSIHSACVEPGHPSVPEFHELRPPMAGGVGLGRQPWPDALGLGRMRTRRRRSVSPQMGRGAFQDCASGCRRRSRLRAPGPSRSWVWMPIARLKPQMPFAGGMRRLLADRLMALFLANQRKDWLWFEDVLAYDNARLSQALIQTGLATRYAGICRGRPAIAALAHVASDHVIRAASGPSAPRASARFARCPKRSTSSRSRRAATISACLAAYACERWRGVVSWRRCAHSTGFWAKTTCRRR